MHPPQSDGLWYEGWQQKPEMQTTAISEPISSGQTDSSAMCFLGLRTVFEQDQG